MPTTYAHYLFGEEVFQQLPNSLQELIAKHRQLYDFGVHGPDILFYHNPFKDDIYQFGEELHEKSGRSFFEAQKEYYGTSTNKDALMAYLLGVGCHFLLDSACHSYVEKKDKFSSASHSRIEAEFDRYLLEREGRSPAYQQDVTIHLHPSVENTKIIAPCYPFTEKRMHETLCRMKKLLVLLQCPKDGKRNIFYKLGEWFHLSSFTDLILLKEGDPVCQDANLRLEKLYNKALLTASAEIQEIYDYYTQDQELSAIFDENFSYHEGWQDIPLYSYEEEKVYEI